MYTCRLMVLYSSFPLFSFPLFLVSFPPYLLSSLLPPPPPHPPLSLTLRITTHVLYAESKFQLRLPPHEFKLHSFLVCFVTDIHCIYTMSSVGGTRASLQITLECAIDITDRQHVYIYCSTLISRIASGYLFTNNVMEVYTVG